MKKIVSIAAIVILVFFSVASADVSIEAEVDKLNITTDDTLTYKLTVTATQRNIPAPELPDLSQFYVLAQSQSSNVSFVKSAIRSTVIFNLTLAPLNSGEFKIEPSKVKIKNKIYSSEAFLIRVQEGKVRAEPQPGVGPQPPQEEGEQAEGVKITL